MRNHELIKEIHSKLLAAKEIGGWIISAEARVSVVEARIEETINLIEAERPELCPDEKNTEKKS